MKNVNIAKGTLSYPWLNKPDTKFNDLGEYKTAITIPLAQGQALADRLEAALTEYQKEQSVNAGKKVKLHGDALPYDIDEDAGTITFRLKSKVYRSKKDGELWSWVTSFFDAKRTLIGTVAYGKNTGNVPQIGGGTVANVSAEVNFWMVSGKVGVSLRQRGVQIITLSSGGGGESADAGAFGFGDEEGFSASDVPAPQGMPEGMGEEEEEEF